MMTSKLDWTVHDIHLALIKVKADGEKALEEVDNHKGSHTQYMRGHFRARVGLASDILGMLYKEDLVMKEE